MCAGVDAIDGIFKQRSGQDDRETFVGHLPLSRPALYDRIRDGGKSLMLLSIKPQDIRSVVKRYGADGICLRTKAASETEADELVAEVGRQS